MRPCSMVSTTPLGIYRIYPVGQEQSRRRQCPSHQLCIIFQGNFGSSSCMVSATNSRAAEFFCQQGLNMDRSIPDEMFWVYRARLAATFGDITAGQSQGSLATDM